MKKFIIKNIVLIFCLCLLLCTYFIAGSKLGEVAYGVNTRNQIEISFTNADIRQYNKLFLGNSRVYRGINPDMIDNKTYNFAHDNDSYNQCYYKLSRLIENGHEIDTLFLGAEYFQFSFISNTRNYIYDNLFDDEYYLDYSNSYIEELISNCKQLFITNQTLLIRSLAKIVLRQGPKGYIKSNGQYIYDTQASPNDKIKRDSNILDFQLNYYNKIIELCHKFNIQVTVFTMPVREGEMSSYTQHDINQFRKIVTAPLEKQDIYIDMTYVNEFRNYNYYSDITHLNSEAADKFTTYFINRLRSIKND